MMSFDSAQVYKFSGWGSSEAFIEIIREFPQITLEWTINHYTLIVWKLACYSRCIPALLSNFTKERVLQELSYRCRVEISEAKRSCLRLICERDDSPSKYLVLFIVKILKKGDSYQILLSDGWYTIGASFDKVLLRSLENGLIKVGFKLAIHGAQLVGSSEACSPLEITSSTMLKLSGNSTRVAKWDSKLGYQNQNVFSLSINGIDPDGGKIPCVDVVITRVYPAVYISDKITRSLKQETQAAREWDVKFP